MSLQDFSSLEPYINDTIIPNYYSLYNRSNELTQMDGKLDNILTYINFVNNKYNDDRFRENFLNHPSFCNWGKYLSPSNLESEYSISQSSDNCSVVSLEPTGIGTAADTGTDAVAQTIAQFHTQKILEFRTYILDKTNTFDILFREQFPRLYDSAGTYATCTAGDSSSDEYTQFCEAVSCLSESSYCTDVTKTDGNTCTYTDGVETTQESGYLIDCNINNNCPRICSELGDQYIITFYNDFVNFKDTLEEMEDEYRKMYNYYMIAYNLVLEEVRPDLVEEDKKSKYRNYFIISFCIIVMVFILPGILLSSIMLLK